MGVGQAHLSLLGEVVVLYQYLDIKNAKNYYLHRWI